jgi:hypothetical protein
MSMTTNIPEVIVELVDELMTMPGPVAVVLARRGDEEMRELDVTEHRYDVDTSRLTRRGDGRVIP